MTTSLHTKGKIIHVAGHRFNSRIGLKFVSFQLLKDIPKEDYVEAFGVNV
jgi:hypothetical protein